MDMMERLLTVFIWAVFSLSFTEQRVLDDYIRHYEEVHLDRESIHRAHDRVRRSLDPHLYLKFRAYNRDFHLKLRKDTTVYSPTHETYDDQGRLHRVDTSFIYQGEVIGSPRSFVHLSVINGTIRGHITFPGETTYHVEPAQQYIENPRFHSVVYDERHVNLDPYRHKREAESASCGNDHHYEWMKRIQESASSKPYYNRAKRATDETADQYYNKYSESANRKKRTVKNLGLKNTCYLYLRSDPMLWDYIKNNKYPGDALTDERTKEEILAFFASHVAALKIIYSDTTFSTYDDSMSYNGVNFLVQRTKIMTNTGEFCGDVNKETKWCNANIDVSNFLNLNSIDNHNDFCLAYVFTYRDFTQGTLGLAWVGSDTQAAGGICEKYKDYPEKRQQVKKSLNTGIVTIVNYGKQVQARVSQLTFAHEVGHNFGSPHDKGPTCAPYGTNQPDASQGNYIMFASATMGDKPHNGEFSSCSKDNITRVLDAVVNQRFKKINCFNSSLTAFCGNGIVEDGEQCDCGYESDCQDTCCWAKGSTGGNECTLKQGATCSPTAGPCCTTSCEFQAPGSILCKTQDDCSHATYCDGNSANCPKSQLMPNNTFCNTYSQVCTAGECRGSVCQRIDWEECFLTSSVDSKSPTREELCFVSCRKTSDSPCVSSQNTPETNKPGNARFKELLVNVSAHLKNTSDKAPFGIRLPAGSPCDNFRGYCDVFQKCRGVDADGPLARLKNLIFNPETLQTIRDWIVVHWWAVMLMGIGLVVVMGVFIKVCAVHTPSSNPRKPAARKLTLPRRHHGNQGPKPQARSVPVHDPPPPYSSAAHGSGPPPPGHGKHNRHNNNKQGGKNNRGQRYEMQPRA